MESRVRSSAGRAGWFAVAAYVVVVGIPLVGFLGSGGGVGLAVVAILPPTGMVLALRGPRAAGILLLIGTVIGYWGIYLVVREKLCSHEPCPDYPDGLLYALLYGGWGLVVLGLLLASYALLKRGIRRLRE